MRIIPPPGGPRSPGGGPKSETSARRRPRTSVPVPESLRRKALAFDMSMEDALARALPRADAAQAEIRAAFAGRLAEMAARLAALAERRARGDAKATADLFRAARDLAATAPLFEAVLVGRIAESLAHLLAARGKAPPAALVAAHVDALSAALREGARDDDPLALALCAELEKAVARHLTEGR